VTRLTTDVTNVQNAYMMLIRTAIAFASDADLRGRHVVSDGRKAWRWSSLVTIPGAGHRPVSHHPQGDPAVPQGRFPMYDA
jgi:hypothetical protein